MNEALEGLKVIMETVAGATPWAAGVGVAWVIVPLFTAIVWAVSTTKAIRYITAVFMNRPSEKIVEEMRLRRVTIEQLKADLATIIQGPEYKRLEAWIDKRCITDIESQIMATLDRVRRDVGTASGAFIHKEGADHLDIAWTKYVQSGALE